MAGLAVSMNLQAAETNTPVGEDGLDVDEGAAVVTGAKALSELERRMAWWEEARFALFIHWGAYSVLGGGYGDQNTGDGYAEQIQRKLKIPTDEYVVHAAEKFRPEAYDAEQWVLLAKNAGMKYVVITAKHHDGFAIYHSKHSDYDVEDTSKWERDPLKELSDACKKHGLKFGVYYSQSQDWFAAFDPSGEWDAPGNPASARTWWDESKFPNAKINVENFERYVHEKGVPQVIELIEDYGVEMVWFDTPAAYPKEYAQVFVDAVRRTNPDIVVNSRVGGGLGDYRGGVDSPVVFSYLPNRYWEAIQSTLHSWGYSRFAEGSRRPFDYLLRMLATVVSKGGNMMINVGPKPDGLLVPKDVETLEALADWSADHIESIRGAGRSPIAVQNWGVVTSKGKTLYLHVFDWPTDGVLRVGGLDTAPKSARLMKGGVPLTFTMPQDALLSINVPAEAIHPVNSVIELTFDSVPAGGEHRLLEPRRENRFHVTHTPHIEGKGLRHPIGVGFRAYLDNWSDPKANVVWKVRAAEEGRYSVLCIYDHAGTGDAYQVRIGDQVVSGVVNDKGTGDAHYVEREVELMRMHRRGKGRMVVDKLGTVQLTPGEYDMTLQSAGDIKNRKLFLPRTVLLVPEQAPNIIYINADDLGWADLSCQGSSYYETPHIDKLAKQGMRFTDAYAPAANCAPSRASCLSGMHMPRHGVYTVGTSERGKSKDRKLIPIKNTAELADRFVTIAEGLKAAGYTTIHLGKWHVGKDPCTQGFDINIGGSHDGGPYRGKYISPYTYPNCEQEAAGEYLTDRLGTEAISFINAHQDKPFFMYLSTFAIHTPFEAKPEQVAHFKAKPGSDAHKNAAYAATIKALDDNVGRVMDELDKLGLAENTLVLFSSDNGGVYKYSRQWPLRAGKGAYYEGGIREPLIVRWPGTIEAGSECSVPVIGIDFFPTFLDAADAPVPEGAVLDGVSLMPLLTGTGMLKDRALYWHFPIYLQAGNAETRDPLFRTRPGSVIRYGDWKLKEYFEDGALELFNLKDDLGEKTNLAVSHPEKAKELLAMLKAWRKEMDAPIPTKLNPEYQP